MFVEAKHYDLPLALRQQSAVLSRQSSRLVSSFTALAATGQSTVLTGTDRLNRQITVDGLAVTDCRQGLHGSFYKPFVTHHIRSAITSVHCSAIWNLVFPFSMALLLNQQLILKSAKRMHLLVLLPSAMQAYIV